MRIVAMNHHRYGLDSGFGIWLILGGALLILVVVALLSYFRGRQSDGLSRTERRELDPIQTEILAMVRQKGGTMLQTKLADTLPYDVEEIAGMLKELESRNLICREWKSEKGTYEITAIS